MIPMLKSRIVDKRHEKKFEELNAVLFQENIFKENGGYMRKNNNEG